MPDSIATDELRRMNAARIGPQVTCPASRHTAMIADDMVAGDQYQQHQGGSIASTVASLWEARAREAELQAEVARLRAALKFYTVSENWCIGGPLDGNSGNFTGGPARAALSHHARKDHPHD